MGLVLLKSVKRHNNKAMGKTIGGMMMANGLSFLSSTTTGHRVIFQWPSLLLLQPQNLIYLKLCRE